MPDPDVPMLIEALAKAQRLLEEVKRSAADAEANPPPISPEDLAAGKAAMAKAVASAERMVQALQQALDLAIDEQARQN